jgi:hypothetical protein
MEKLGDVLDRRVALGSEDGLAEGFERLHQRIVLPEDHSVIQLTVDPAFHNPLDVAEVANHVASIEGIVPYLDFSHRVVSVRVLADAVIVQQSMAVAELDALGHGVHMRLL